MRRRGGRPDGHGRQCGGGPGSGRGGGHGADRMVLLRPLVDFLRDESAGGALLAAAAVVALAWANSPWRGGYERLWSTVATIGIGGHVVSLDLRHWVNDALMTLFFFVAGLEIKRELVEGELRGRARAALPIAAALGGMVVPAALYLAVNAGTGAEHGWGVPMATDIAMAVGVLALAGASRQRGLSVFLLALAIVDDIGAIVVIAVVYSNGVEPAWLVVAVLSVLAMIGLRWVRVGSPLAYLPWGVLLWFALHEAHVHPTLAGVVCGLLAPTRPMLRRDLVDGDELAERLTDTSSVHAALDTVRLARGSVSVVEWLEHVLHPWVTFLVVPVFALANAGIELGGDVGTALRSRVALGIVLGLVVGKPVGIVAASWLAVRTGVARLPDGLGWRQIAAAGAVAGVGFTVALFVAELAFTDARRVTDAKLGILAASVLAATVGALALRTAGRSASSSAAP